MDFIYSRRRIRLSKFYIFNKRSNNKNNRTKKIIIILMIIIFIVVSLIKGVIPVFNQLCIDKAKSVATIICNRETTKSVQGYEYSDFIIIHKDKEENIIMLESNVININVVISDIAEKIQVEINNIQTEDILISLGSFTGFSLLSGRGPKIPIRISTIGNVSTNFKSEFIEKGINQTLHRLYLEIECEISILTPFNTVTEQITNQFIVAENLLMGIIPNSYYNLEGITSSDALNLID